jgi:hypothetical protein
MNAIISSGSALLFGTGMAYAANRYRAHRAVLETVGGVLIIGGLVIIGFASGCLICHP